MALVDQGTIIGALAVLAGSSVGAMGPVLSNYVIQRTQTRYDLSNRRIAQRETLYSDFLKEAARSYANSLTDHLGEFEALVSLYAFVSHIRLVGSDPVLLAAEALVKRIMLHYGEPDLTIEQVRVAVLSQDTDPFADFSLACRKELRDILNQRPSRST